MINIKKIFALALTICLICVCFAGCGGSKENTSTGEYKVTHTAKISVKGHGDIELELYGEIAPITVKNFVKLANEGFYDGLTFHRVINGFMIQGGDPDGNGTGGSDEEIKGEFTANGVENPISHTRGVISMARNSISMDSASSQFFIMHADGTYLDGQYAAFGCVTKGMNTVDSVAKNTTVVDNNGTVPANMQPIIEKVTVEEIK